MLPLYFVLSVLCYFGWVVCFFSLNSATTGAGILLSCVCSPTEISKLILVNDMDQNSSRIQALVCKYFRCAVSTCLHKI